MDLEGVNRSAGNATGYDVALKVDEEEGARLVVAFTVVYTAIFVTGVIGNVSTCIVIARNRSMHTATNYYLFSLAVSDMLLLVSGLPPEMYRIWSPHIYVFGDVFCVMQGFCAETSANATVLTITAFTAERYLAICHPFLSHTMSKLSRVLKYIIFIWIAAMFLAVPQAMEFGVKAETKNGKAFSVCTVVRKYFFDYAFEISTFVIFVLPMTFITVLYILIGIQLKKSTDKRPSMTNSVQSEATRKKMIRTAQAQNRVVKMLIAVVTAFFVCWAPFHAQRLLAVYLAEASTEAQTMFLPLYTGLNYASGVLYFLSTTVNPVLYHIMSHKYRKAFKKTFGHCRDRSERSRLQRGYHRDCRTQTTKLTNFLENAAADRVGFNKSSSQTSQSSHSSARKEEKKRLKKGAKSVVVKVDKDNVSFRTKVLSIFRKKLSGTCNYDTNFDTTNTISNSSLKDTDEMDFVCSELVKHMKEINELL